MYDVARVALAPWLALALACCARNAPRPPRAVVPAVAVLPRAREPPPTPAPAAAPELDPEAVALPAPRYPAPADDPRGWQRASARLMHDAALAAAQTPAGCVHRANRNGEGLTVECPALSLERWYLPLGVDDRAVYADVWTNPGGAFVRELWALDAATGATRWRAPLPYPTGVSVFGLRTDDARAYVLAGWRRLLVFDRATGARAWSLEADSGLQVWPTPGRAVIQRSGGGLEGVEPATGRRVWRSRDATALLVDEARGLVLVRRGGALEALDGASGAARWRVAGAGGERATRVGARVVVEGPDGDLAAYDLARGGAVASLAGVGEPAWRAVRGGWYYAVARRRGDEGLDAGRLYGIDTASGRRWRAATPVSARHLAAVGDEAVYAATDGGRVDALDPRTGARRWFAWTGAPHPDDPGRALVLAPAGIPERVLVGGGAGVLRLDPARPAGGPATAVIEGEVRAPDAREEVVVWVGDQTARPDARGRFRATVQARGLVTVVLDPRAHCLEAPAVTVDLRRPGPHRAVLAAATAYCCAHHCD